MRSYSEVLRLGFQHIFFVGHNSAHYTPETLALGEANCHVVNSAVECPAGEELKCVAT